MTPAKETVSEARAWLADKTHKAELGELLTAAQEGSTASESECRINRRFDDGSLVIVNSFKGSEATALAFDHPDDVPTDLVSQHFTEEQRAEADAAVEENLAAAEELREQSPVDV